MSLRQILNYTFTREQRKEFDDAFELWRDRENPDLLPIEHVGHMLRSLDQTYTWTEVLALKKSLIASGMSNGMTKREFEALYLSRAAQVPDGHALKYAFEVFDKDKKNAVDLKFMRWCLQILGEQVQPADFDSLVADLGLGPRASSVNYEFFRQLCLGPEFLPRFVVKRRQSSLE